MANLALRFQRFRPATVPREEVTCWTEGHKQINSIIFMLYIMSDCNCLIPAQSPKEAIEVQRRAKESARGNSSPSVANPASSDPASKRCLPNPGYQTGW
jgi:hypothetical protein